MIKAAKAGSGRGREDADEVTDQSGARATAPQQLGWAGLFGVAQGVADAQTNPSWSETFSLWSRPNLSSPFSSFFLTTKLGVDETASWHIGFPLSWEHDEMSWHTPPPFSGQFEAD